MTIGLVDIRNIKCRDVSAQPAGTILLARRNRTTSIRLQLEARGGAGHQLDLETFELQHAQGRDEPWLGIVSWRLVVDPSSFTRADERNAGRVYVVADRYGFVGNGVDGDEYINSAGAFALMDPAMGYFTRWQLVSEQFEDGETTVIVDHASIT